MYGLAIKRAVPHIMKQVRADKGAIPFVLSGANVMCPGLTSAGGEMSEELDAGTPVAIMAEGKEHAMAIGVLTLSTEEMYVLLLFFRASNSLTLCGHSHANTNTTRWFYVRAVASRTRASASRWCTSSATTSGPARASTKEPLLSSTGGSPRAPQQE